MADTDNLTSLSDSQKNALDHSVPTALRSYYGDSLLLLLLFFSFSLSRQFLYLLVCLNGHLNEVDLILDKA